MLLGSGERTGTMEDGRVRREERVSHISPCLDLHAVCGATRALGKVTHGRRGIELATHQPPTGRGTKFVSNQARRTSWYRRHPARICRHFDDTPAHAQPTASG